MACQVSCRRINHLNVIVGCIALILTAVLSRSIIRSDGVTPIGIGDRNSRSISIFILHIVGATVACTEELIKYSVGSFGGNSLARHHIAELGTTTVFAHDAVVDDHINTAFHYLVSCTIFLGHDAAAIELANERVIDAPGDITPYTLLIGCGNSAKSTTIDIAVRVVFVWHNGLIVSTSEVETGEVSAKNIDSTMTCLIFRIGIDMGARGERRHDNMTAEDDVIDMLIFFSVTTTAVLVVDTAVEYDRALIACSKFKLKLSEADKGSLSNLEMSFGTEAAKGEEVS